MAEWPSGRRTAVLTTRHTLEVVTADLNSTRTLARGFRGAFAFHDIAVADRLWLLLQARTLSALLRTQAERAMAESDRNAAAPLISLDQLSRLNGRDRKALEGVETSRYTGLDLAPISRRRHDELSMRPLIHQQRAL